MKRNAFTLIELLVVLASRLLATDQLSQDDEMARYGAECTPGEGGSLRFRHSTFR